MNGLNKLYLVLLVCIGISFIFSIRRSLQKINYKTGVFTSIPIHARNLNFKDSRSDELGSFYAPDPNHFAWKEVNQYFDNKRIDVPDSLHVEYFDYTDSTFYNETVAFDPKDEKWMGFRKLKEHVVYSLGIAQKGTVLLWASSPSNGTKLLFQKKLPAIEPKPKDLYYNEYLSKRDYIKVMNEMIDDSIKSNIKLGFYIRDYSDSTTYTLPEYLYY